MTSIALILTVLSSLIFLTFFVLYNKNIISGSGKPNIVSWGLFSLITLINAITYMAFTNDILKGALAFTDFFTCIVITFLILSKGQYFKLNISEKIIIVLAIISILVWWVLHSAVYANLLLQPAYILAFIPTIKNAWINPKNESSLVWFMWAFSFFLTIVVIIIRWDNNFVDIVNSLIAFSLHFTVGLIALRKV
ncbi:MAG: hypothetical protein K9L98_03470 [Candidatus Pacebacteria bacterium]|nr:hypothetical protein [Candidatus Paceibacterota bacterium]MCF7863038.1 hypothetical protein [Candidatus Paceibacterota bacterium]